MAYRYNTVPLIANAYPATGQYDGTTVVTITGLAPIGNGSDITAVTLNTVPAFITQQDATTITVIANSGIVNIGLGNIVLHSIAFGDSQLVNGYRYNIQPVISVVYDNNGPYSGLNSITIVGSTNLGNGSDITGVSLRSLNVLSIVAQTTTTVTVLAANGSANIGTGPIVVNSTSFGTSLFNSYTYNLLPVFDRVYPPTGKFDGGTIITIHGVNLGNGSDVTSVLLRNAPATILSQTANAVTVTSGNPGGSGLGDVQVSSVHFGVLVATSAYRYNAQPIISTVIPADGPAVDDFTVTITGTNLGNGTDITSVFIGATQAIILTQSDTQVVVVKKSHAPGLVTVSVNSINFGPSSLASAFQYNTIGVISFTLPNAVAIAGLSTVTINGVSLNSNSPVDVTSVEFNGLSAAIQSVSATQLVVTVPPTSNATICDVVVRSFRYGVTRGVNAFTYKASFVVNVITASTVETSTVPAEFTLCLDSPPTLPVTVSLPASVSGVATPSSLTFTALDWNVPQYVNVSAIDDLISQNTRPCSIVTGNSVSADPAFSGLSTPVSLTCVDNDPYGIVIAPGQMGTLESQTVYTMVEGTSKAFTVRLLSQPTATITLAFGTVTNPVFNFAFQNSVSFTDTNWFTPQNVFMQVTSDGINRYQEYFNITITPSGDDVYTPANAAIQQRILLLDNDYTAPVLALDSGSVRSIVENGASVTITALLTKSLSGNTVTIAFSTSDSTLATSSTPAVVLTDADYLVPFTYTVDSNRNFIDDGDITFSALVTCSGPILNGAAFATPMLNVDIDVAGFSYSNASISVNETGSKETFGVTLSSKPLQTVTVSVVSANTAEVVISPSTLIFTTTSWNVPQYVEATGVRDNVLDTNTSTAVTTTSSSSDPKYASQVNSVTVVNYNIFFPTFSSFSPTVFPQAGVAATIIGTDLIPGMQVFVNGSECFNVSVTNRTQAVLVTPPLNQTGYQNIYMRNPDGGWVTFSPGFFYTDDCPREGEFGRGLNCIACPAGGICPGGFRVQAVEGYWTPGESSGVVIQCRLGNVSCPGGVIPLCRTGYSGYACASCSTGYWQDNVYVCNLCDDVTTQVLLLLCQFSFLILFILAIVFAGNAGLNQVQFCLFGFKTLWVVSQSSIVGLPDWINTMFGVLNLFAGDLDFFHPGCSGIDNWIQLFLINMGILLGASIPIMILLHLQYRFRLARLLWGVEEKYRKPIRDYEMDRQIRRMSRGIGALLLFIYEVATVNALTGVTCGDVAVSSSLDINTANATLVTTYHSVLLLEPDVECFTGSHIPVFVFCVMILVFLSLVFPLTALRVAYTYHRGDRHSLGPILETLAVNTTEEFVGRWWFFGLSTNLSVDFVLAILHTCATENWAFIGSNIVLGALLIILVVFRPFIEWYKNLGLVIIVIAALLQTWTEPMLNYFTGTALVAEVFAYLLFAFLMLFTAGIIMLTIWFKFVVRFFAETDFVIRIRSQRPPLMARGQMMRSWQEENMNRIVSHMQRVRPTKLHYMPSNVLRSILSHLSQFEQHQLRLLSKKYYLRISQAIERLDMSTVLLPADEAVLICGRFSHLNHLNFALCDKAGVVKKAGKEQLTDHHLAVLSYSNSALTNLCLRGCNQITQVGLRALRYGCPNLTHLDLSFCNMDDETVALLAHMNVVSLSLSNCTNISDAAIAYLAEAAESLETLNLSDCTQLTDTAVRAIAAFCGNLHKLNVAYCNQLTDVSMLELAEVDNSPLSALDCSYCPKITEVALEQLRKVLPWLRCDGCNKAPTPPPDTAAGSGTITANAITAHVDVGEAPESTGEPQLEVENIMGQPASAKFAMTREESFAQMAALDPFAAVFGTAFGAVLGSDLLPKEFLSPARRERRPSDDDFDNLPQRVHGRTPSPESQAMIEAARTNASGKIDMSQFTASRRSSMPLAVYEDTPPAPIAFTPPSLKLGPGGGLPSSLLHLHLGGVLGQKLGMPLKPRLKKPFQPDTTGIEQLSKAYLRNSILVPFAPPSVPDSLPGMILEDLDVLDDATSVVPASSAAQRVAGGGANVRGTKPSVARLLQRLDDSPLWSKPIRRPSESRAGSIISRQQSD
eukprot:TRINITY_DN8795_c0_g1_i2.p1 TRINITY_DN8795_c0_g1~~TRINITY_DN8795_c0_g1_i2.p1  ORF type:complete len:2079 (-),score=494.13 TRINITY_DN8795_c0_g1_i2:11-6247(-)